MKAYPILAITAAFMAGCSAQFASPRDFETATRAGARNQPRHVIGDPYYWNGRLMRPRHQPDYSAFGRASWYGPTHDGRRTANGEIADTQNLFAAHPTLPLPSYVAVRNLMTDREITVRVNDRSPIEAGTIIALSDRAAEILDLKHQSNVLVHVRYLSPAPIEHIGRNHY